MSMDIPGGSEPGYLAFALVDDLIDLLIQKGVLTNADRSVMLRACATRLSQNGNPMGQRCAQFITERVKP